MANSNQNYSQQNYNYVERGPSNGQYGQQQHGVPQRGVQQQRPQQQWQQQQWNSEDYQQYPVQNGSDTGNYYPPGLASMTHYHPPPPPPNYGYPQMASGYPPYPQPPNLQMQPPPPPPPTTPIFPSYGSGPGHVSSSIPGKAPLPVSPPPPPPPAERPEAVETPKVEDKEVKSKPPILVGKRRGGRVLPTGVVKKARAEDTTQAKKDPWSQYMNEVKRYKDQSCEEDRKNRPLVK